MHDNHTPDQNQVNKNENIKYLVCNYDLAEDLIFNISHYRVAQQVANGEISPPNLRKSDEYGSFLKWIRLSLGTIELIKIFEIAGLTLSNYQVGALNDAISQRSVGNSKNGDYDMIYFFSFESKERIESLDLSNCNYHSLRTWEWLIDREAVQDGPDDSPAKIFLSKIRNKLVSEELLVEEQEMITELQKIMPEISALMKRFGIEPE